MPGFTGEIQSANSDLAHWFDSIIVPDSIVPPNYIYYNPIDSEKEALKAQINKLNKTINNMATFINENDLDEDICSKIKLNICEKYNNGNCKECIKKYFEGEQ